MPTASKRPALGGLAYAAGFVISTAALHGLGLGIGFGAGSVGAPGLARALGGLTGLAGVVLDPRLRGPR